MTVLSGQWHGAQRLWLRVAAQSGWPCKCSTGMARNGSTNLLDSISAFYKSHVVLANCKKTLDCAALAQMTGTYAVVQGALPQSNRLTLLAPGAGKAGSVDVSVGSHPYLASTVGVVVFGVFRSGPVIYLREMY